MNTSYVVSLAVVASLQCKMRHVIHYIKDHLKTLHHRKYGFIRGKGACGG